MIATRQRRALRAGTEIDYCGMRGIVAADAGGERVTVNCEGSVQHWYWRFEGVECTVVSDPAGEAAYDNFDAYASRFPEVERFRAWVTNHGRCECTLIRLVDGGSPHGGLPGNYMAVTTSRDADRIRLAAHDCDDGLMVRDFPLEQADVASSVLAEMKKLAPLSMSEAAGRFRFIWE